ncbi:MAG: hypothetical protein MUD01_24495 [Chloroflexaceae bacterium]|nr:hypothetical protein [Chloroflexaceae bacterium]
MKKGFLGFVATLALTIATLGPVQAATPAAPPATANSTAACVTSARVTISDGQVVSRASAENCSGVIEVFTSATSDGTTQTQQFSGTGTQRAEVVKAGSSGCSGQAWVKIDGRTVASSSSVSTSCQAPRFPFPRW